MCNFLQYCNQNMATVIILNLIVPTITIVGPQVLTQTRSTPLSVATNAFTANCDGSSSTQFLEYAWSITAPSTDSPTGIISSTSRDPSKYLLPPFSLKTSIMYTLIASVTNTVSKKSASASMQVFVQPSSLVAIISGGATQSVRLNSQFTLDASGSYDKDQISNGNVGMYYSWSCSQSAPVYSSICSFVVPAAVWSSSALTSTADAASAGSQSTFTATVALDSRQAVASTILMVIAAAAPVVTMTSSFSSKINVNSNLVLSGSVELPGPGSVTWTVSDASIQLSSIALTAVTTVYEESKQVYQSSSPGHRALLFAFCDDCSNAATAQPHLVLPPYSLPERASLTFSLVCTLATGLQALSSVTVVTNGLPLPGTFRVSPSSGIELSTAFQYIASLWTDPSLPITFEFGFLSASSSIMVVQSRSQSAYGQSQLPAGSQMNDYNVTCTAQIFNSLNANASAIASVTVSRMQVNQSALQGLVAGQLTEAAGNADKMKQTISTISSVLNSVNCSLASNCFKLNRSPCSTTANTCGPCLTDGGFVGDDGDGNAACIPSAVLLQQVPSGSSSGNTADVSCASPTDCNSWEHCDHISKSCVISSKSCSNRCSRHGRCSFVFTSTEAPLSDCKLSDPTCSAVCTCRSSYNGPSCSVTDEELTASQALREQLVGGLGSLVLLENPDAQVVSAWSNSLSALTQNPLEVSPASATSSLSIASNVANSALNLRLSSEAVKSLFGAVNSVTASASSATADTVTISEDNYYYGPPGAQTDEGNNSMRRRLIHLAGTPSDSSNSSLLPVLDTLSRLMAGGLVAGQRASTALHTNFRMASQVIVGPDSPAVTIPRTDLEIVTGVAASAVHPLQVSSAAQDSKLSLMLLGMRLVGSDSTNLTSSPLRLLLTGQPRTLLFTLQHLQPEEDEEFHPVGHPMSLQWMSWCEKGVINSSLFACPGDINVTVSCDGSSSYESMNTCPQRSRHPACIIMNPEDNDMECTVVNATAAFTECLCQPHNSSHASSSSHTSRRRLQGVDQVAGQTILQVASVAQFVSSDFSSVMSSASSFDSAQALEATLLVIETFAGLWLGMAMAVLGFDYLRRLYKSRQLKKEPLLTKVYPATDGSSENVEEMMHEYFSSFYPSVFSDTPRMSRLFHEMFEHHAYFRVFAWEHGLKKWIGVLELLTNLTANMFLLAIFYDLEWPSDDGSCNLKATEQSCVSQKAILNRSPVCAWTPSGGAAVTAASGATNSSFLANINTDYFCVWQKPTFNPTSMIVVSVFVVFLSSPIYLVLNIIFSKILSGPTLRDIDQEDEFVDRHRDLVLSALQTHNASDAENQTQQQLEEKPGRISRVFSTSVRVSNRVARLSMKAQETASQSKMIRQESTLNNCLGNAAVNQFSDINKFYANLSSFERTLRGRELDRFRSHWRIPASNLINGDDSDSALHAIAQEIDAVEVEAKDLISQLKQQPLSFVGVTILDLFVRDLIGRGSRKAKIFGNQASVFEKATVVTWGVKCLALSLLFLLNGYFIFSCMLYGRDKGISWQRGWLIASMANLFIDVMIKQVNIVLIVKFFIPTFIYDTMSVVKQTINVTIGKMCKEGSVEGQMDHGNSSFSATDYLFVSTRVAKAFPGMLESALVLAYNSPTVSIEQRSSWTKETAASRRVAADSWFSSAYLVLVNCVFVIGSQPTNIQSLFVSCLNPLVVSAMAFIGSAILHTKILGVPIGFGIVFAFALLFLYWLHNQYDHFSRAKRPDTMHDAAAVVVPGRSAVSPLQPQARRIQVAEGNAQEGIPAVIELSNNSGDRISDYQSGDYGVDHLVLVQDLNRLIDSRLVIEASSGIDDAALDHEKGSRSGPILPENHGDSIYNVSLSDLSDQSLKRHVLNDTLPHANPSPLPHLISHSRDSEAKHQSKGRTANPSNSDQNLSFADVSDISDRALERELAADTQMQQDPIRAFNESETRLSMERVGDEPNPASGHHISLSDVSDLSDEALERALAADV